LKLEFNFNQSGVIPYRNNEKGLEILLITSIKKKNWIIPKGYIEFNLSPFESAKKEAYEEAGVTGTNETIELGEFIWNRSIGKCHIKIFSMEVLKIIDNYPEKEKRKRKWFLVNEAAQQVKVPEISSLILSLEKKLK